MPAHGREEDLEDLYEHAPCGYLSTAPDGTIVRANRTFLEWTGYRSGDLVGARRFADLLTAGGRIYHETHYAPLLRMQRSVREIAFDLVRADGSRLPVLVNAAVRHDGDGDAEVVRVTVFDATDRREYERELLRARRRAEESEARARVLAETLQQSLMPPSLPGIPGLRIAAAYRPAGEGDEVGGDFYDVFEPRRGEWAVVLGDVCGKGAAAAAVTALARYTIRAAAAQTSRPARVLRRLNDALIQQEAGRFCTAVYARLRMADGRVRMTVAAAGHPLPLRAARDGVRTVGRTGTLLGVLDAPEIHDHTVELAPGDTVLLYTDGATEARSGGALFGADRLGERLWANREAGPPALVDGLIDELLAFQGGAASDDIALIALAVPSA